MCVRRPQRDGDLVSAEGRSEEARSLRKSEEPPFHRA
jgi:hypothetical protein